MLRLGGLMMLMLFVAQGRPAPGKVNSTYDKSANFQTLKTYSWVQGSAGIRPIGRQDHRRGRRQRDVGAGLHEGCR